MRTASERFPIGTRIEHTTDGETGTVIGHLSFGIRVAVDVNPDEWRWCVIGPPSNVTAVWESWTCART
jgi:hypothetical protein